MSNESTTSAVVKEKKGFSTSELSSFFKRGDVQSTSNPTLNFNLLKPDKKTLQTIQTDHTETSFFSGRETRRSQHTTGFMGEFSDVTDDQLDAMVNTFNKRRTTILDKKRAPGRSQLFLDKDK